MRVRIRGIFATALTKIFLDRGYIITLPSDTIARRFGIEKILEPPDVTIKSDEIDPERIIAIGFPEAVEKVHRTLRPILKYSGFVKSKIGVNALVVGEIYKEGSRYVADLGDYKAIIRSREPIEEGKRVLRVKVPPTNISNRILVDLTPGIIGRYARLFKSNDAPSVSKHIKDEDKKRFLLDLARNLPKGYTVHRRSAAEHASSDQLLSELRELVAKLEKLLEEAKDYDIGAVIYPGEALLSIYTSTEDRRILDEIRSKVIPTIPGHHSRKTARRYVEADLTVAVDVLEKALEIGVSKEKLSKAMKAYALSGEEVKIVHRKPDGSEHKYRGQIVSRGEEIVIHRTLTARGTYDGLNEPIEPGDYAITRIYPDKRYLVHEYYSSSGELKGIYANVNTPPEILPGVIRYNDLYIDVVRKPGEEPKIIDKEELESRLEAGLITKDLYEKALSIAEELKEKLASQTLRCFLPRKHR